VISIPDGHIINNPGTMGKRTCVLCHMGLEIPLVAYTHWEYIGSSFLVSC